ncbi:MAG: putative lipoprotein [Cyanobacteria bacterium RYN_339]|nr:putative lipoprotein [Cyanobacteria bacterium RYN_339]
MRRAAVSLALLGAGCAWGPGTSFGTVVGGPVSASLPLTAGRTDTPDGSWKTSNGYGIKLDGNAVTLELNNVALLAPPTAASGGGGGTFDPAHPPAGYTLCHNGHCHRTDGAVKTYDEIQADLAGGGTAAAATTLVTLAPTVPTVNLAPGGTVQVAFSKCAPNCNLPRGTVSTAKLALNRLLVSGQVQPLAGSPAIGGATRRWKLALALGDLALAGPLAVKVDRDQPATRYLSGQLTLTDKVFDGIDWARLASQADPIELDADQATNELLIANLGKSTWVPKLDTTAIAQ